MNAKNKKIVMIAGGGAALIGIGYLLTRTKRENSGSEDPTGNGTTAPIFQQFNAKKIADELYEELVGTGFASIILNPKQKETIFEILKNVSNSQFGKVMELFGKKAYNMTSGNNYFLLFTDPTYYTLDKILKNELTSTDYATLRKKYPNYL